MEYEYLRDIVKQFEKCGFTDEIGHKLENNKAFRVLKEHSKCDGMATEHKCKNYSQNYLCDTCLDRVYDSHQG